MRWSRCVALLLVSLVPATAVADDYFKCLRPDGTMVITNRPRQDNLVKCKLVMKGWAPRKGSSQSSDSTSSSTLGTGSEKPGKDKKRHRSQWTPPESKRTTQAIPSDPSVDRKDIDAVIREASRIYNIPELFIRAVIEVESAYKVKAPSYKGAMGLMQLMPGTAKDMGVTNPWNPYQNIMGGTRLLRILANKFDGDIPKVISAYHAGGGSVSQKGGIPYEGTDGYVRKVLSHYYRLKDARLSED